MLDQNQDVVIVFRHNLVHHFYLFVHSGALCEGARRNFDRKGVVATSRDGISSDKALELAIEAGAEDVQEIEDEEERPILQVWALFYKDIF